jgi:hypothetical protein
VRHLLLSESKIFSRMISATIWRSAGRSPCRPETASPFLRIGFKHIKAYRSPPVACGDGHDRGKVHRGPVASITREQDFLFYRINFVMPRTAGTLQLLQAGVSSRSGFPDLRTGSTSSSTASTSATLSRTTLTI